jgi:hypothetical protein
MARNLILGAIVAIAAFGCATSTSPPSAADSRAGNLKSAKAAEMKCAAETSSRIKRSPDQPCPATPSTTYSQKELESTGRNDTGDALRQLDPRIQ